MPTYSYRCQPCGDFDVTAPMSQRPQRARCPSCGGLRGRAFSAPALGTSSRALDSLAHRAGRSAEAPEVVRSVPGAARVSVPPSARERRYPPLPRS